VKTRPISSQTCPVPFFEELTSAIPNEISKNVGKYQKLVQSR